MLAVASRLCGLHAQLMSSAELTLWARIDSLDRQAVQRALWQDRSLVKTWAMRGTLNLLPSSELPMWHAALGTSPRFLNEAAWKRIGITLDQLDRLTEAIGGVLDGRIVTRDELAEEVRRITGSDVLGSHVGQNSWGTMLRPAAFTGRLCFGPNLGQRVRFTHPKTWLAADAGPVQPDAAAAGITRRFLSAYGPATDRDLARWWSGGSGIATARQWIASLGDDAVPVDIEGTRAWMLASDARKIRKLHPVQSVSLLPGFDQYVIAASCHADRLMSAGPRSRVYRPQGWISPVLLVNGFMHGTWRHAIKGSRVKVTIQPFDKPPAWVRRAAALEAERLAVFLGCTLDLAKF